MPSPEPYRQRVERIAEDEGRNYDRVAQAVGGRGIDGASRSLIDQAKRDPRKLNRAIIEAVADELDVKPGEFHEWWAVVIAEALRVDHGNIAQVLNNTRIIMNRPTEAALAALPRPPKRRVGGKTPAPRGELSRRIAKPRTSVQSPKRKPSQTAADDSQGSKR